MTAHAEAEPSWTGGSGEPIRRDPAMQSYCATLSRFTSSVQSTELSLRHEEATTGEEHDRLETAAASRLRGIDKARAEAAAGLEHIAVVRAEHGVDRAGQLTPAVIAGRSQRHGGADIGVTLASLARRRDELRVAESEFHEWRRTADRNALRIVLGVAAAAWMVGAVVVALTSTAPGPIAAAVLAACIVMVTAAGLGVGTALRLPQICTGPGLARVPDAARAARFGMRLCGAAAVALVAVAVLSGSL